MGSINYGSQIISLPFEAQGTSFNINQMMYGLIPTGILSGGVLAKSGLNSITISPFICWIQDNVNQVAVKIQTQNQITLTVSSINIYVVLRFAWVGSATNYMDVLALPFGSINPASDLIVGKCVYYAGVLQSIFDYTETNNFDFTALQTKSQDFLTQATEPYSNQVSVLSGKFVTANQYVAFTGPSLSPALNNTTFGRIDLIYIDETGALQKLEGIDSANPVVPIYSGKNVVAEIHRGAGATFVSGNQIVTTSTLYKAIGLGSISVSELNLGTGVGQINASSIPIIDAAGIIISNTVDGALTELSFGLAQVIQAGSAVVSIGDVMVFSGVGVIKFTATSTPLQIKGLALQAGVVGNTIGVSFRRYITGLINLVAGEIYYIGVNGSLSLTDKSIGAYGRALSTTELLMF